AAVIETILTGSPSKGAIAGGLSALATAIYGLVTPLFKQLVGAPRPLTWGEEMCRTFVSLISVGCIASALGNRHVFNHLPMLAMIWGMITYLNPSRCNLHSTNIVVLYPNYQ